MESDDAVKKLQDKTDEILKDMHEVLERHGIHGVSISRIGLHDELHTMFMKSGPAPQCPNGKPAVFRCAVTPSGEVECKWVCE